MKISYILFIHFLILEDNISEYFSDLPSEWLHLGGDVNKFLPILTSPTQVVSTSDLSLQQALQTIKQYLSINQQTHIGKFSQSGNP